MTKVEGKKIIARECKFALHLPNKDPSQPDLHIVKERVFYDDGTEAPFLNRIYNFERPFWLTKPKFRNFEQKKEYQEIEKLDLYKCTQSRLQSSLSRALGKPGTKEYLKQLFNSPYVYGADIPSEAFIKRKYQRKWNKVTENSICALDIETDVNDGTEDPIIVGAVMADKAIIAVTEDFVKGFDNVVERLQLLKNKHIKQLTEQLKNEDFVKGNREVIKFIEETECRVEFVVVPDCIEAIKIVIAKVHTWQPDFLAIWNVNFDIPKIIATLDKYGVDPADVFCDPSIPKELRLCHYKEGSTKKVTASGKVMPISYQDQWHTFHLSASFYVIDAMCTYRLIRLGGQELPNYGLEAVLKKELGVTKLKLTEGDKYRDLAWHQYMQKNEKLFYTVYNFFDSYLMVLLDKKTKDIAFSFSSMVECTKFESFKRQPMRIVTSLFFFMLEKEDGNRYVLASMGLNDRTDSVEVFDGNEDDEGSDDDDDDEDGLNEFSNSVLSASGWIITLPAHMAALGKNIIKECKSIRTMIRAFAYDSDATSAYPSATEVGNVSKVNAKREVITVEGIEEDVFRTNNMNLVTGPVNAMEYSIKMFKAPGPFDILDLI